MPVGVLVVLMLSACDTDEVLEAPSSQSDCDQPGNLIANCGFDVNLDDWQILPGSGVTHSSEDGSSKLGCAQIVSVPGGAEWFASIKQCVTFPSVATYAVGADIRVITGSPDSCVIAIGGTDSCPSGTAGIFLPSTFNPSGSWSQSSPLVTDISVAWDAAVVILHCRGTSSFTVRFDDAFVRETVAGIASKVDQGWMAESLRAERKAIYAELNWLANTRLDPPVGAVTGLAPARPAPTPPAAQPDR